MSYLLEKSKSVERRIDKMNLHFLPSFINNIKCYLSCKIFFRLSKISYIFLIIFNDYLK